MKTKLGLLILGAGLIITQACTKYPPASERLLEDLAILTQYDTKVNFNNYKTFAIATSITKITDKDTTQLTDQLSQDVLAQIAQNMENRGFVKVAAGVKPDFGIDVVYYQNTYVYTYYYDWWGYYPYYYYYYPYYPVYYSSYTAGTANIELIDLKDVDNDNQKLYLRWNAYIRGLLTGSHTNADIMNSVNQAFIQTPQLRTTAN
jgi:hypothetical protein